MRVRSITLTGLDEHDAQREGARRDEVVVRLAAGIADEAVLSAAIAGNRGIGEGVPVGFALAETRHIAPCDLLDAHIFKFRWARMTCDQPHDSGLLRLFRHIYILASALEQFGIGVAHQIRLALSNDDTEIDHLDRV